MKLGTKASLYDAPPTQETPFTLARGLWDERHGTLLARIANLQRLLALACLTILGLGSGIVALAVFGNRTFPYVVEVAESGQVRTIGLLPQAHVTLTPATLQYVLQEWLPRVRGIITDPVAFGDGWQRAYKFMTARAIHKIRPFVESQIKLQNEGHTVAVTMGTFFPIAGHSQSYQVEWVEETFDIRGHQTERKEMVANLHVDITPPTKIETDDQRINPLGVFIRDFEWAIRARK